MAGRMRADADRCIEDRHLRLLLPRRPAARDLQGHDAAVHRAERRALADAARRAGVDDALARGHARGAPAARATVDAYARRARRPGADGRLRRLPGDLRRDAAAARVERRPRSATTTRSRCCAPSSTPAQAGARRLPRRAGASTSRSAARCTRTSRTQRPDALNHRNWAIYERQLPRDVDRARHAASPRLYPGVAARQDQLDPPPGGQGPRPRPRRRGLVGAGPHRRGDPLDRPVVPVRRAVASGVPRPRRRARSSTTRRSSTTSSPPPRSTRPQPTHSEPEPPMKITNPADRRRRSPTSPPTTADRGRGASTTRARAAQPRWAARAARASASPRSRASASGSSRCTRRSRAR